jgi:hypothetical protein
MSKTTIRSAVIRVVEIGVTRLRRGEGDDEAVVVADEASNGRPDELLGVDLLPTLPRHQDDIADRGNSTRLCLPLRRHPKADGVQVGGTHGSDRVSPEG